jgi:hypothetical protein
VREAENLILEERRSLFDRGFEEEAHYSLPDGSEAYLFRRRHRPESAYDASSLYTAAEYLQQTANDRDLIVVHPPHLFIQLLEYYAGAVPVSGLDEFEAVEGRLRLFALVDQDASYEVETKLAEFGSPTEERQFGELQMLVFEFPNP